MAVKEKKQPFRTSIGGRARLEGMLMRGRVVLFLGQP